MYFKSHYVPDFSDRNPEPITDKLFSERWSPRAFQPFEIPEVALAAIFDAARWSPSCFNEQPWQFFTTTNTPGSEFSGFLELLVEANQQWAKNASLLGFIVSSKYFSHNNKPNATAAFDCGAAWMAMTLQARKFGLFTHGMAGIKYQAAYEKLPVNPETHQIICGFALGVLDSIDSLPTTLRAKEKPSPRKTLHDIWVQQ